MIPVRSKGSELCQKAVFVVDAATLNCLSCPACAGHGEL
jgi:hypothetical protein